MTKKNKKKQWLPVIRASYSFTICLAVVQKTVRSLKQFPFMTFKEILAFNDDSPEP